ncbi:hypothetical protein QFC22_002806 [Naganishia vaughanmartiniae]|uniref:Uncharacterized protein n=1 Tax=Naganishia vaughanmartiniae TaxID=1424756 RepID=A0ACC2XBY3_9TREE|nr:hypothetical protein QFC22_002806 [Naganishia vaughanmartiniae]
MPRLTTLPTLLAQLPAFGTGALVQPVAWKERFPNSFYKVTRTKLRTKPVLEGEGEVQYLGRTGPGAAAAKGRSTDGAEVKGKAREQTKDAEDEGFEDDAFGDEMEIGQVTSAVDSSSSSGSASGSTVDLTGRKAHGQAWGVLFWNGQPKFPFKHNYLPEPPTPNAKPFTPQTKIRRALKDSWTSVDPASLSAETAQIVQTLESGKRRDWYERREKVKPENLTVKDLRGLEARRRRIAQQLEQEQQV